MEVRLSALMSLLLAGSCVLGAGQGRHLQGGGTGERNGWSGTSDSASTFSEPEREDMARLVRDMFYHGYTGYMQYAFPHDELKPLSKTYTDSLGELGNLNLEHLSPTYNGVAMTLIDSLSTLAVLRDASEFGASVIRLRSSISFDQDVRVNVFEATIRLLGGLLSGHILASDSNLGLMPDYEVWSIMLLRHPAGFACDDVSWLSCADATTLVQGELLSLGQELGNRLLPAFLASPTGLPYAWVNLRHGVRCSVQPSMDSLVWTTIPFRRTRCSGLGPDFSAFVLSRRFEQTRRRKQTLLHVGR